MRSESRPAAALALDHGPGVDRGSDRGLDRDRALALDRDRGTMVLSPQLPRALTLRLDLAPTLIGAAIEAAPIEACRKADGLRFVLDVT